MVTYLQGNLLEDNAEALVNTVNTVGVMGKGIALQFKIAFPHNYEVYREACKQGRLHIGELLVVKDSNLLVGEKLIINFPTKTYWRLPSAYEYIEKGLVALRDYIVKNPVDTLAMPALGCGNGGLNWRLVKPMLEKHLVGLDADIGVYEPNY